MSHDSIGVRRLVRPLRGVSRRARRDHQRGLDLLPISHVRLRRFRRRMGRQVRQVPAGCDLRPSPTRARPLPRRGARVTPLPRRRLPVGALGHLLQEVAVVVAVVVVLAVVVMHSCRSTGPSSTRGCCCCGCCCCARCCCDAFLSEHWAIFYKRLLLLWLSLLCSLLL